MALTAAEKMRRYRERIKNDPEKYERQRKKDLERVKQKRKKVADLNYTQKKKLREQWKNQKRRQRNKMKTRENNQTNILKKQYKNDSSGSRRNKNVSDVTFKLRNLKKRLNCNSATLHKMNPTNKLAYQRHMYSGPRKSRKKVQATLRRHHGNYSNDFYRLEAWRNVKKQKVVEETDDCPVVFSPHTTEDEDRHQLSNLSTAQDPPNDLKPITAAQLKSQDSFSGNEIKVFCPKCNTDVSVSHIAEGIQEDKTKKLVAKVYHYFEQEYEELKKMYGDLDLTPLSKFRQRTALATGVSETTLLQILKEEEERNADKRQEPPQKRRAARKRRRQTDSSSEEGRSDDNDEEIEQPSYTDNDEPEIFIPIEELEPGDGEISNAQIDPISLDVKTEPLDTTDESLALNEPAPAKRRGRKISRKTDDTSTRQHTPDEFSAPAASSNVSLTGAIYKHSLKTYSRRTKPPRQGNRAGCEGRDAGKPLPSCEQNDVRSLGGIIQG